MNKKFISFVEENTKGFLVPTVTVAQKNSLGIISSRFMIDLEIIQMNQLH